MVFEDTNDDIGNIEERVKKASLTRVEGQKLLAPLQDLVSAIEPTVEKVWKLSWAWVF